MTGFLCKISFGLCLFTYRQFLIALLSELPFQRQLNLTKVALYIHAFFISDSGFRSMLGVRVMVVNSS